MFTLRDALKIADVVEFFPTIPRDDITQQQCDSAKRLAEAALRALIPYCNGVYQPHYERISTYIQGIEEDRIALFSRNVEYEDGTYRTD